MSLITKDLPTLVFMLLPGFIAAGVFYTLTAYPKSTEFERVVQALIFTTILRVLTAIARALAVGFGGFTSLALGLWTTDVELGWSIILAVGIGSLFAYLANGDVVHTYLRKDKNKLYDRNLTTKTSYPSEWYTAFSRQPQRYVILHLDGGRRLRGWPWTWPDQGDKGHFVLTEPEWILDDSSYAPLHLVDRIMLPATEVKMVEFLRSDEEAALFASKDQIDQAERLLIESQQKEVGPDGSQSTAAEPEPTTAPTK